MDRGTDHPRISPLAEGRKFGVLILYLNNGYIQQNF